MTKVWLVCLMSAVVACGDGTKATPGDGSAPQDGPADREPTEAGSSDVAAPDAVSDGPVDAGGDVGTLDVLGDQVGLDTAVDADEGGAGSDVGDGAAAGDTRGDVGTDADAENTADASTEGGADASDGGASCAPGSTRPCYSGPAGTRAVGRCVAGLQLCAADGSFMAMCFGEMTPVPEACGNMVDENCNGMIDDGCGDCAPGATRPCYGGPAATDGRGICRPGTQTCAASRTWGTACVGEIRPDAERCNGSDDDCDGMIDEAAEAARTCAIANATPACTGGRCVIGACNDGFADCDRSDATGCEVDLARSESNCGACGRACAPGQACTEGRCGGTGLELAVGIGGQACALQTDGSTVCWGANRNGQLGDGTALERAAPVLVDGLPDARKYALGETFSCALRRAGSVHCWGDNAFGQLGDGTAVSRPTHGPVPGLNDAIDLVACNAAACALRRDGTVVCWGQNNFGQLGDGTMVAHSRPAAVSGLTDVVQLAANSVGVCALLRTGAIRCWGAGVIIGDGGSTNRLVPTATTGVTDAVQVSVGGSGACALRATGAVLCWGGNSFGEVGDGTMATRMTPVTVSGLTDAIEVRSGTYFTCARRRGNAVTCWGINVAGQLGDGTRIQRALPTTLSTITDVTRLALGSYGICARKVDGAVSCWGGVRPGNGGDSNNTIPGRDVFGVPASAGCVGAACGTASLSGGQSFSCAVLPAGRVGCWGGNDAGQLGEGTTLTRRLAVGVVVGVTDAVEVVAGNEFACARRATGAVLCWGRGNNGQLGNGTTTAAQRTPVTVTGLTDATGLAAGTSHACAVRASGAVVCWGVNAQGQIGDGTTGADRTTPVPVVGLTDARAVGAGAGHSCALRAGGTVVCWGERGSGQVGDGTMGPPRLSPVAVVGLGGATALTVGGLHSCALLSDGTVRCWGLNGGGQLGDGTVTVRPSPTPVMFLTNALQIDAGQQHTCAVRAGGTIVCWGRGAQGQLGDRTLIDRPIQTIVVGLSDAVRVSAGILHTCARRASGAVRCWGYNASGELGDGTTVNNAETVFPVFGIP